MPTSKLSDIATPLEEPVEASADEEVNVTSPEKSPKETKLGMPQPKARPKAAPRKKTVHAPTSFASADQGKEPMKPPDQGKEPKKPPDQGKDLKKPPQAAPRSRAVQEDFEQSPPKSVIVERKEESEGKENKGEEKESDKEEERSRNMKPHPHVGPKPSPKRGGVGKLGSPARSRTSSLDESPVPQSPRQKDPSNLSVKEKALLAHKVLMSAQDKPRPGGPPIPRKPKPAVATPTSAGTGLDPLEARRESIGEDQRRGSTSIAEDAGNMKASPMHKKKLPPGAFNMMMMGAVFGPGHSADRQRSATVCTSESGGRERAERETSPDQALQEEDEGNESHAALLTKPSMDEESGSDVGSTSASPVVHPKFKQRSGSTDDRPDGTDGTDGGESGAVDYDVVLTWTPDVTAAWLGQVGLASYQQPFLEKGIQGYMLFDMDGHKLKVIMDLNAFICIPGKLAYYNYWPMNSNMEL